MLSLLRSEMNTRLAELRCSRKPALRRSDEAGWLLATDLPLLVRKQDVVCFAESVRRDGWRCMLHHGWLLLDHELAPGNERCTLHGEAACLESLILRRGDDEVNDREMIRMLARASEQGENRLNAVCSVLHRDFAERLRKGVPLPGALLPYLYTAYLTVRR